MRGPVIPLSRVIPMTKKQMTIPVFVPHQGCPHCCVFCNQWETSGTRALPDVTAVHEKIERHLATAPPGLERIEVAFFGGSFTGIDPGKQGELLGAAAAFVRDGRVHSLRLSTRPDLIDEGRLALLKDHGVETIELGVQSLSNAVLAASRRGHTAEDVSAAVRLLRERGFRFVLQLMPGLPGDSEEESLRTARNAARLRPDGVRIYPAVVLDRTELADSFRAGRYRPLSMEEAVGTCARMLLLFERENIPVIRIGLHPFAEEETKNILDGPYHPAFGFLVKARVRRGLLERLLRETVPGGEPGFRGRVRITLPEKEKEEYIGPARENILYLKKMFPLLEIDYRAGDTGTPVMEFQGSPAAGGSG